MGHGPIPRGACVALGVLIAAGCNLLLGYEAGQLGGGPTSSGNAGEGGTAGASPTGTGTAGAGGSATATGGSAGSAGAAPTTCNLWPEGSDGCADTKKCSVVNESTGLTECVTAGPQPAWARCNVDWDCQDRLWCDHETGVCKPVCQTETDCPAGGSCLNATALGGGTIPSLQICTAYCDPHNAMSCNQSNGTTNCLYGNSGFDCFQSADRGSPEPCGGFLDCGPPYTCWSSFCRRWCDSTHLCPPFFPLCLGYSPALYYDGVELGYCSQL